MLWVGLFVCFVVGLTENMGELPKLRIPSYVKRIGKSYYIKLSRELVEILGWNDGTKVLLEVVEYGRSKSPVRDFCLVVWRFEWEHGRGEEGGKEGGGGEEEVR